MDKRNYLKSGIWYMFGNLLIKGISFFTLPIFTRLLSTGDFGKFNLFLSYENILNVIIGLGVAGTIKTAYFDQKENFQNYFSSVLSLLIFFCIGLDLIFNIGLFLFRNRISEFWNVTTVNLLLAYSLATALYSVISVKYVIEVSYKKNLFMSLGYTFLSVGLSLILCFTFFSKQRYMARILGNALPLIIITYSIALRAIYYGGNLCKKTYWEYALKLGIPLIFHSLSLVIMQQADKIMVNGFCGDELMGIYSLACNISVILTIVQSSIDSAWAPWFYSNMARRDYQELRNKNRYIVYLFVYITAGFNLIAPEVISFASPIEYQTALYALIPLNISVFASFMYMFAVNKEYFHKKTKIIAIGTIFSTVLDIALNTLLIPRYGFISASYTTLISKLVLFLIHWIVSNKIDKNVVIDIKNLLLSLVIVILVSYTTILFKDLMTIRYILLFIISVITLLLFRKSKIRLERNMI